MTPNLSGLWAEQVVCGQSAGRIWCMRSVHGPDSVWGWHVGVIWHVTSAPNNESNVSFSHAGLGLPTVTRMCQVGPAALAPVLHMPNKAQRPGSMYAKFSLLSQPHVSTWSMSSGPQDLEILRPVGSNESWMTHPMGWIGPTGWRLSSTGLHCSSQETGEGIKY